MKYDVGMQIVYGLVGVCKIDDIGKMDVHGIDGGKDYYTLTPTFQSGTIYAPVDTDTFMRPVINKEEAEILLNEIAGCPADIYYQGSMRATTEHYEALIRTHDCMELLKLIKSVYLKNVSLVETGKKLGQIDKRFMKQAEDLLYGEFSVALELPRELVKQYVELRAGGKPEPDARRFMNAADDKEEKQGVQGPKKVNTL